MYLFKKLEEIKAADVEQKASLRVDMMLYILSVDNCFKLLSLTHFSSFSL